jgi:peptidyl-prolyl cis-trans isomerase-like 3
MPCSLFSLIVLLYFRIIDGFETLDAMERVPVGKKNRPLADIRLERVTIHANPLAVN